MLVKNQPSCDVRGQIFAVYDYEWKEGKVHLLFTHMNGCSEWDPCNHIPCEHMQTWDCMSSRLEWNHGGISWNHSPDCNNKQYRVMQTQHLGSARMALSMCTRFSKCITSHYLFSSFSSASFVWYCMHKYVGNISVVSVSICRLSIKGQTDLHSPEWLCSLWGALPTTCPDAAATLSFQKSASTASASATPSSPQQFLVTPIPIRLSLPTSSSQTFQCLYHGVIPSKSH